MEQQCGWSRATNPNFRNEFWAKTKTKTKKQTMTMTLTMTLTKTKKKTLR